jgi:hypothetical protein
MTEEIPALTGAEWDAIWHFMPLQLRLRESFITPSTQYVVQWDTCPAVLRWMVFGHDDAPPVEETRGERAMSKTKAAVAASPPSTKSTPRPLCEFTPDGNPPSILYRHIRNAAGALRLAPLVLRLQVTDAFMAHIGDAATHKDFAHRVFADVTCEFGNVPCILQHDDDGVRRVTYPPLRVLRARLSSDRSTLCIHLNRSSLPLSAHHGASWWRIVLFLDDSVLGVTTQFETRSKAPPPFTKPRVFGKKYCGDRSKMPPFQLGACAGAVSTDAYDSLQSPPPSPSKPDHRTHRQMRWKLAFDTIWTHSECTKLVDDVLADVATP